MTYVTIEAEIAGGRIVPKEGVRLPEYGRALVTLMPDVPRRPNWDAVESVLGVLQRSGLDSAIWQQEVRAQWNRD